MGSMVIFWACLFVVLLLIELATYGLVTVWFCGGALIALLLAALKLPIWLQITAFAVASTALLIFTRPITKKLLGKNRKPMNTDRVLGRKCIVLEDIDGLSGNGSVKIDGIIWSAKSENEDMVIEKGAKVIVKKVDGVKVIVAPDNETEE